MRFIQVAGKTYAAYVRVGLQWQYLGTFAYDVDPTDLQGRRDV